MMYEEVVRDFALRTRKNLEALEALHERNDEVFEVTQLINSMLGLLVFPQQEYVESIPKTPLKDLLQDGWPIPRVTGNFQQVTDLNQLIRYLRNAVAHFNIKFIGDGKDGENNIKVLRVWNMAPVRDKQGKIERNDEGKIIEEKNWEADLTVTQLRSIANRFIDLLLGSSSTHNPSSLQGTRRQAARP
jgi:hypothetical protein